MKNVFFTLAFMLIGTFAFANSEITSDMDTNKTKNVSKDDNQERLLRCSSKTVTVTTKKANGSITTSTTTTVDCDTAQELAKYHKEMNQSGTR